MRFVALLSVVCAVFLTLVGCRLAVREARRDAAVQKHEELQVQAALARYRQLVIDVDAARLADMFSADGELSHNDEKPYAGHDTILEFLKGFSGYKIESYELSATSTAVDGTSSATQLGSYSQVVVTPAGQTIKADGSFKAEWRHQPDGRWLLRRMHTTSPARADAG